MDDMDDDNYDNEEEIVLLDQYCDEIGNWFNNCENKDLAVQAMCEVVASLTIQVASKPVSAAEVVEEVSTMVADITEAIIRAQHDADEDADLESIIISDKSPQDLN